MDAETLAGLIGCRVQEKATGKVLELARVFEEGSSFSDDVFVTVRLSDGRDMGAGEFNAAFAFIEWGEDRDARIASGGASVPYHRRAMPNGSVWS